MIELSAVKKLIRRIKGLHEGIKPSAEFLEQTEKFLQAEKKFLEELPYVNIDMYHTLMEHRTEVQTESENTYFEEGFRMGFLIGIDIGRTE